MLKIKINMHWEEKRCQNDEEKQLTLLSIVKYWLFYCNNIMHSCNNNKRFCNSLVTVPPITLQS